MQVSAYVISTDPLIIHGYNYSNVITPAKELSPYLKKHKVTYVISIAWSLHVHNRLARVGRLYAEHKRKFPNHEIIILANDQREFDGLHELGVPTIMCNHNSFINEKNFTIVPAEKQYDGVINSRMQPYKRIELARETKNLCLVASEVYQNPEYTKYVTSTMPYMDFVQFVDGKFTKPLTKVQLSELYGKCRCGLILSAAEGACFAAGEYLLCGLPVVTTHNKGGRDTFYHSDYTIWCDDNPESVKEAVQKAATLTISPEEIRERALGLMHEHRENYIAKLNEIALAAGKNIDFNSRWDELCLNNKIKTYITEKDALKYFHSLGISTSFAPYRTFRHYHEGFKKVLKRLKRRMYTLFNPIKY